MKSEQKTNWQKDGGAKTGSYVRKRQAQVVDGSWKSAVTTQSSLLV